MGNKKRITRRSFLKAAGAGTVVASLPAVMINPPVARAAGRKKLNLAEAPFISKGPNMIAFAKGYYKKMGLDCSFKWFFDGGLIVAPLLSGEADIGSLTPSAGIFNAIARGADLTMFLDGGTAMTRERSYGATLVSMKLWNEGIRTPADLKKITHLPAHMSVKGSINMHTLDKTYMKGGVDPRKVRYEFGLSQPSAMKLMLKGGVNVTNLAYHFAWLLNVKKKAKTIAITHDVAPGSVISCSSFSRARMDDIGRETFVRFAMGYLEGVRLFNQAAGTKPPPEDIMAILTKFTLFKGERGRKMLKNIQPHWSWTKPDAKPHKEGISTMQDHWVDYRGYVKKKVDINKLVNHSIVHEAAIRLKEEKPFRNM